jgi:hypothetical protein
MDDPTQPIQPSNMGKDGGRRKAYTTHFQQPINAPISTAGDDQVNNKYDKPILAISPDLRIESARCRLVSGCGLSCSTIHEMFKVTMGAVRAQDVGCTWYERGRF